MKNRVWRKKEQKKTKIINPDTDYRTQSIFLPRNHFFLVWFFKFICFALGFFGWFDLVSHFSKTKHFKKFWTHFCPL